jgi:hypothetical protein
MRAHLRAVTVFVCVAFFGSASAQTLCGVASVKAASDGIDIAFDGKKSLRLMVVDQGLKTEYTASNAGLTGNGKKVDSLLVGRTAAVYVNQNANYACVFRIEERDSKLGLAIEEYLHAPKEPPVMNTEFVEAI